MEFSMLKIIVASFVSLFALVAVVNAKTIATAAADCCTGGPCCVEGADCCK
jgi:hypothetical protein